MADEPVEQGHIIQCPMWIDRKWRRGSYGTDKRFVRCEYLVSYIPGTWSEWPDGPKHNRADEPEQLMQAHVATHRLGDYAATVTMAGTGLEVT